jgi:cellulose synthase/poly-beta-1,6-N-acetylglucosamine synthase-like glycosyltransferase
MPAVTFVVPCYNDVDTVEATIRSIYDVAGGKANVIVVNDCSTDDSGKLLERLAGELGFTLHNNESNLGKSQTLNRVSELVVTEVIVFVDADVIVKEDAFTDAITRLSYERVAAVSCPYVPENKGVIPLMQHIEYSMLTLIQGAYNVFSTIALWGGFVAVKKAAFEQVGRFSTNAITEDMDLALKLNEHGWKVEQSFKPIHTHVPDTFSSWYHQKLRWSSGGAQCIVRHWRVWIKNPIHLFFIFSYFSFMLSMVVGLAQNVMAVGNVVDTFAALHKTYSLLVTLRLTAFAHDGLKLVLGLIMTFAFTFFSVPYVLPLIPSWRKWYVALLAVPFSVLYIPVFSFATIAGVFCYIAKSRKYESKERAW